MCRRIKVHTNSGIQVYENICENRIQKTSQRWLMRPLGNANRWRSTEWESKCVVDAVYLYYLEVLKVNNVHTHKYHLSTVFKSLGNYF